MVMASDMTGFRRRTLVLGAALAGSGLSARAAPAETTEARLADLEARNGGRLGVAIADGTGRVAAHRGQDLFALCSTYKILAACLVLHRVDAGDEDLGRRITYGRDRLVAYSPATETHAGRDGLRLGELCAAAITLSDNTAGNLLLDSFGGPAALTAYLRSTGDQVTRLDRTEPTLNEIRPGDERDTTAPIAMAATLQRMLVGGALSPASRDQALAWLSASKTGDKRIRAGVPRGWRTGDKTGSGDDHTTNDVAVILPPGRAPIIVAAFYSGSPADGDARDAVLAEVGRIAAAA